jgi:uncharacterized protein (DUF1015 family)
MTTIKAFHAYRPLPQYAATVAARPYDVLNRQEAKEEATPLSFLHVSRAEIDLPDSTGDYDDAVYQQAKNNFERWVEQQIFKQDTTANLYIYAQTMNGRRQYGIAALTTTEDYEQNRIKKHEFTRYEKEIDRIKHMSITRLHSEPLIMTYRNVPRIDEIVAIHVRHTKADCDFVTNDGIQHQVWVIDNPGIIIELEDLFAKEVPHIYIADGHHRAASSAKVAAAEQQNNPHHTGHEPYNYFLSVLFPDNQLAIMDYNRVVKDLGEQTASEFLAAIAQNFEINPTNTQQAPTEPHTFSLYLDKQWYNLKAKPHTYNEQDTIGSLDVNILSDYLLQPILGIEDQRTDKRIDFVGGIRGLEELARRVDSGEMCLAIALYPVSVEQLLTVADNDQIMPPKSTWFEPKLRSGLLVHQF